MIRTFILLLITVLVIIITIPFLIVFLFTSKPRDGKPVPKACEWLAHLVLPRLMKIAGAEVHITGKENMPDGPALYVANHQSYFDIMIVLSYMTPLKGFIAKKEVRKVPLLNGWLKVVGCIYIDRANLRSSLDTINDAEEALRNGHSLVVFPEGTRSHGKPMREFKGGSLRCAIRAGVPIVPFVIDGAYKLFEEHKRITPASVNVKILPPVYPDPEAKTNELAKELHDMIERELKEAHKND